MGGIGAAIAVLQGTARAHGVIVGSARDRGDRERRLGHDSGLEDALRAEQRNAPAIEDEALGQDRARQHVAVDVHVRPQPLERRQANTLVQLPAHEAHGRPPIPAGADDA
jgi:hypothetical protein